MGNSRGGSGKVSRSPARHSFILMRPARACDAEGVARRIAACRGVKEVCLTSGNYAFVVEASNGSGSIRRVCNQVRKAAGGDGEVSVAVNHYVYRSR